MKTKYYNKCRKTKRSNQFTDNKHCKMCMYLSYRFKARLEFSKTILSDEDMKKEMKSIKKISPKGLDALGDLAQVFDEVSKIKSFDTKKNRKYYSPRLWQPSQY